MIKKNILILLLVSSILTLVIAGYEMLKGILNVDAFNKYPECEVLIDGSNGDEWMSSVYAFNFEDKLEAIPIPICLAEGRLAGLTPGSPPQRVPVLSGYRAGGSGESYNEAPIDKDSWCSIDDGVGDCENVIVRGADNVCEWQQCPGTPRGYEVPEPISCGPDENLYYRGDLLPWCCPGNSIPSSSDRGTNVTCSSNIEGVYETSPYTRNPVTNLPTNRPCADGSYWVYAGNDVNQSICCPEGAVSGPGVLTSTQKGLCWVRDSVLSDELDRMLALGFDVEDVRTVWALVWTSTFAGLIVLASALSWAFVGKGFLELIAFGAVSAELIVFSIGISELLEERTLILFNTTLASAPQLDEDGAVVADLSEVDVGDLERSAKAAAAAIVLGVLLVAIMDIIMVISSLSTRSDFSRPGPGMSDTTLSNPDVMGTVLKLYTFVVFATGTTQLATTLKLLRGFGLDAGDWTCISIYTALVFHVILSLGACGMDGSTQFVQMRMAVGVMELVSLIYPTLLVLGKTGEGMELVVGCLLLVDDVCFTLAAIITGK